MASPSPETLRWRSGKGANDEENGLDLPDGGSSRANAMAGEPVGRGGDASLRRVWALFVVLRAVMVLSPGYVHPDEHFQNAEVAGGWFLGLQVQTPWEFGPGPPARSAAPVVAVSGLAFSVLRVLSWVVGDVATCPFMLFVCPRVVMFLLTLTVDRTLMDVCKRLGLNPWPVAVAHAIVWPTLVFHVRPFSNTVETVLLVQAFRCVVLDASTAHVFGLERRFLVLGFVGALGMFTRFTFAFFALPLGLYVATDNATTLQLSRKTVQRVAATLLAMAAGSFFLVALDSYVFRQGLVVSPWNSLAYNMDTDNLAKHGIHPRWLHVVVNVNLMFAPLWICALVQFKSYSSSLVSQSQFPKSSITRRAATDRDLFVQVRHRELAGACALAGLLLLSVAPHQEARFLLPMGPLLCVYAAPTLNEALRKPFIRMIFVGAMVAIAVFFGVLHHGGETRALRHVSGLIKDAAARYTPYEPCGKLAATVITVETYMPPRFLLDHSEADTALSLSVIDTTLQEAPMHMRTSFGQTPDCPTKTWLLQPRSVALPYGVVRCDSRDIHPPGTLFVEQVGSFSGHISTENWPTTSHGVGGFLDGMTLAVYQTVQGPCI